MRSGPPIVLKEGLILLRGAGRYSDDLNRPGHSYLSNGTVLPIPIFLAAPPSLRSI
jgi:hypothetical protein